MRVVHFELCLPDSTIGSFLAALYPDREWAGRSSNGKGPNEAD